MDNTSIKYIYIYTKKREKEIQVRKMYRCVKSMYNDVKAKVRYGAKCSDYANCTQGVKQGDVCSPILLYFCFSLFINELALEIINHGRHG